jgi:hypothetical protein
MIQLEKHELFVNTVNNASVKRNAPEKIYNQIGVSSIATQR